MKASWWQQYYKHSALNLGQAFRDLVYFYSYPKTTTKHYSFFCSVFFRSKSFLQNVWYSIWHPLWTGHTQKELEDEFSSGGFFQWFLYGFKPWSYIDPTKK